MTPIPIDDPADPRLAPYAQMRERDLVGREGRFVAEGEVVLRVLLSPRARFPVESVLLAPERLPGLAPALAGLDAEGEPVERRPRGVGIAEDHLLEGEARGGDDGPRPWRLGHRRHARDAEEQHHGVVFGQRRRCRPHPEQDPVQPPVGAAGAQQMIDHRRPRGELQNIGVERP